MRRLSAFGIEHGLLDLAGEHGALRSVGTIMANDTRLDLALIGEIHDLLNLKIGDRSTMARAQIEEREHGSDNGEPDQGDFQRKPVRRKVLERTAFAIVFRIRHYTIKT